MPFRRRNRSELRPLPWLTSTLLVLLVVIGGGLIALWIAFTWADGLTGLKADAEATLRLDATKTALTVAAGLGAGVTLLLALRRQSHVEYSATEQQITEQYVAAVEQLGSDKAPVRLGGLYALERIGNDHQKMRQTVMDVWCAYLRMPYTPPAEVLRENVEHSPWHLAADAEEPDPDQQPQRRQELQVRLTAQRLIRTHLYIPEEAKTEPATYWYGPDQQRMNLDLTGAILTGFGLDYCHVGDIRITNAHIHGHASLSGAQFHGFDGSSGVQFHGDAWLREVEFHGYAWLLGVEFHGNAYLDGVEFHKYASLSEAQFHGDAYLAGAQFDQVPNVEGMRIKDKTRLPDGWTVTDGPATDGLYAVLAATAIPLSVAQQSTTGIIEAAVEPS